MLVVSDLRLPEQRFPNMSSRSFLESQARDLVLNLQPDYRYMKIGYYVSMHAEVLGDTVIPNCQDILDAYRAPILLIRAKKRGINVSPYIVSNIVKDIEFELDLPIVVFPLNPFSNGGYKVAQSEGSLYRAMRSLSMNQKYPVCAEKLLGPLYSMKSLFGAVEYPLFSDLAERVYREFRLPIVHLIMQVMNGVPYLCSVAPLHAEELTETDLQVLSKRVEDAEKYIG